MLDREFYTSGQVARLLGVSVGSIKNFCDDGRLPSHTLPFGDDRRISRDDLLLFLDKYSLPSELVHDPTEPVYTTGEVASLFHVSARTVTKWCDSKKLTNYRIPGSKERRVRESDLVRFAEDSGLSYACELLQRWLLYIGNTLTIPSAELVTSWLEAGFRLTRYRYRNVILDCNLGKCEVFAAVKLLKDFRSHSRIIVLLTDDDNGQQTITQLKELNENILVFSFPVDHKLVLRACLTTNRLQKDSNHAAV